MNKRFEKKCMVALLVVTGIIASGAAVAQEAVAGWHFSAMPYAWLPGVKADLKYGPPSGGSAIANVRADNSDVLSKLRKAFTIAGEAPKSPWLIATDYMYLDLGKTDNKAKRVDFNPGSRPVKSSTTQVVERT